MIESNKQQEALTQEEIDAVLQEWRQGDFVLGNQKFIRRVDTVGPITQSSLVVGFSDDSQKQLPNWLKGWFLELWSKTFQSFTKIFNLKENIKEDHVNDFSDLEEIKVRGLVVVTQTCDILRTCSERPFVEVVPLKEVDETYLSQIQQSMRPQYAFIPGSAEYSLAADLDCVMTLEKAVVARWQRNPGCTTDQEVRALGQALARKRARFAFPDDFIRYVKKLQERIKDKHNKPSSLEGKALRALREIRIQASPSWENSEIELFFWFIRNEDQIQFQDQEWHKLLDKWLEQIPPSGRFKQVEGTVIILEDMTAKDYVESDPLDLEHLSS